MSQLFRQRVSQSFSYSLLYRFFQLKLFRTSFLSTRTIKLTLYIQNYFTELANEGWYNSQNLQDRIALLALYMARIRDEVFRYANLWNIYIIRADLTRLNHVSRKPFFLYRHLKGGTQRYAQLVDVDLCNKILKDYECQGKKHIVSQLYSLANV